MSKILFAELLELLKEDCKVAFGFEPVQERPDAISESNIDWLHHRHGISHCITGEDIAVLFRKSLAHCRVIDCYIISHRFG